MNLPSVPVSVCNDSAHAEITIIFLMIIIGVLVKLWWGERKKYIDEEERCSARIESKLDKSIADHDLCEKRLPFTYVTKEEFKNLLTERNRQWVEFNEEFGKLIDRFWNHSHDVSGKVDRQ